MIITGHGHFATGMESAMELIGGKQEYISAVDFASLDNIEVLEKKLKDAETALSDCEGIIVFTDLIGGSPFKTAVSLWASNHKFSILSGTNLGELLEIAMSRTMDGSNLDSLTCQALSTGRLQLVKFELPKEETSSKGNGI